MSPSPLAALVLIGWTSPAQADDGADQTIARMTAHYNDPGLEIHDKPFALLYLRTTEGMREANSEGEFSDPAFWDDEVIPTFADHYLDAYAAWERGDVHAVPRAWRLAFEADPARLTCTQLLYLGINAHVNNDLAFVIADLGSRYTYLDHKHVDEVLADRVGPIAYPRSSETCARTCSPTRCRQPRNRDIDAWRQLAWLDAQRLRHAPDSRARRKVARQILRHARDKARQIIRWNR